MIYVIPLASSQLWARDESGSSPFSAFFAQVVVSTRMRNGLLSAEIRLMQTSKEFRAWWLRHDVGEEHLKRKELVHPDVGLLVAQPMALLVADDPKLKLFLYTSLPEAETASKLAQLQELPSAPSSFSAARTASNATELP